MDIYNLTTPFALLDVETKAAMHAHKDAGGTFEWFDGKNWMPADRFTDGASLAHRAVRKPSLRVIWVNEYTFGLGTMAYESEAAASSGRHLGRIRTVKFVEAL